MHATTKRRTTHSDDPVERKVYETASKDELDAIITTLVGLLPSIRKPRGWTKHNGRGRPPKKRRGAPEVHTWRPCVAALAVKEYLGLSYREMASFLAANPDLATRLGFTRPPSHSTLNRAMRKLSPTWIRDLNRRVVEQAKGG